MSHYLSIVESFKLIESPCLVLSIENRPLIKFTNKLFLDYFNSKESSFLEKEIDDVFDFRIWNGVEFSDELFFSIINRSTDVEDFTQHKLNVKLKNDSWENSKHLVIKVVKNTIKENNESLIFVLFKDIELDSFMEGYSIESYNSVFENSISAIFITRPEGDILDANTAACKLFEYSKDELRKLGRAGIIDPSTPGLEYMLKERIEKRRSSGELIGITKSGKRLNLEFVSSLFEDEQHQTLTCTIINDISERKKADRELSLLINNTEESYILLNKDLQITSFNNQFYNLYKKYFGIEILRGDNIINYAQPDRRDFVRGIYKQVLEGQRITSEITLKDDSGDNIYFELIYNPVRDENKEIIGAFITALDITQKINQKNEILQTKLNQEALINNTEDAVWSIDQNYCIITANKAYKEMVYLMNRVDIKDGDNAILKEFGEDENVKWLTYYSRALKGEKFNVREEFHNPRINVINYANISFNPIVDNDGIISGVACYAKNITEEVLTYKEIKNSETKYKYLFENNPAPMFIWDFETLDIIDVNNEAVSKYGYSRSEFLKLNIRDIRVEEEKEEAKSNKGRSTGLLNISRHKKKNNEVMLVEISSQLIQYNNRRASIVLVNDVTQREIALNELKDKEQNLKLLESVITNTNDVVLITEAEPFDEPGPRIIYVNDAFTRMTGYTAEEVIGKSPRILQGPKSDLKELKKLSESLRKWESTEVTTINYKKNGEPFWINFTVSPVADENGWFTHWVAIERDVTERKNLEIEKDLTAEITAFFRESKSLSHTLDFVLTIIATYWDFKLAEFWLLSADSNKINLTSKFATTQEMQKFYEESKEQKSFKIGEGMPGNVLADKVIKEWKLNENNEIFPRWKEAEKIGVKSVLGIPLIIDEEVLGVLVLGRENDIDVFNKLTYLINNLIPYLSTEIKRKQLENELSKIFTFAPDVICVANMEGFFTRINPAACELLEYTEEELLSRPYIEFIHPDDISSTNSEMISLSKGRPTFYFENRYITKSGKIKWLAWTATPSPDEGLLFAVAKDITEKKNLTDLLKKSNNLARIGSWEIDVVNNTVFWSDITKEIREVERDFVPTLEIGISNFKEGHCKNRIQQVLKECIENGTPWDEELEIITHKGNLKWVRTIGEAEFLNGKCIKVYGSFQDIDARKKAEIEALKIYEEKNTILESIADAFFAVDKNWIVTYWNKEAEILLETPRAKILGKNLWDVFSDRLDSVSYNKITESLESYCVNHFEDYYEKLDRWYEISVYPSETGLSVYFKNINDRKKYTERISKANRDLEISNKELEQFAYVASHDLQEPLRMVTSFLTQLEKKYSDVIDDNARKYIHFAVDGAKRMRQIILDLLEFSRVGRLEDKSELTDVNEIIEEVKLIYDRQIEESKAKIEYNNLPLIQTFKIPLRQIFQNLISNSLKYHKKEDPLRIKIESEENETHWIFSISDNGIGINPEYFDKIFIIFQRLHNKDEYTGTGMGLAICKKIVENMGGSIWVESQENMGSKFYFSIAKKII